jgi:hypothetical protein
MFGHDNHSDHKGGQHGIDHGQFGPIDNAAAQASGGPADHITVTPPGSDPAAAGPGADNGSNLGGFGASPAPTGAHDDPAADIGSHGLGNNDDLLDIKHQALTALTPLVGQLEQTPEEQFRTTMMMIQASDNHTLIKTAYDAAQKISNEKERAQALLDIVNEINYFTQHSTPGAAGAGAPPAEPNPAP